MAKLGREDISSTGRTFGEELKGPRRKDTDFLKEYAAHLAEINDLYDDQARLLEDQVLRTIENIDEFIDENLKKLETTGRSIRDIRDLVSDMLDDLRGTGKIISEREKSIRNFRDLSAEIEQSLQVEGGASLRSLETLVKKAEKQKELNRYTVERLGTINQQKKALFDLEDQQLQAQKELQSLKKQYSQRNLPGADRSKIFDQIREQRTIISSLDKEITLRKRNIDLIDIENRGISKQLVDQARVNLEINREVRKDTGVLGGLSKVLEKLGMAGAVDQYENYVQALTRSRSLKAERTELESEQASLKGKRNYRIDKITGARVPTVAGLRKEQIKTRLADLAAEEAAAQEAVTAAGGSTLGVLKNILATRLASISVTGLAVGMALKIWQAFKDVSSEAAKLKQNIGSYNVDLAAANFEFASAVDWLKEADELAETFHIDPVQIFTKSEIGQLAEAKNLLGLSSEQTNNLAMRMKLAGKSADDYQQSILDGVSAGNTLNRTAFAGGNTLKEVLGTSESITLSLGNSGERLGKAVVAANALGLSLKNVDSVAEQLLNFESSIESEMKAQLLTGNQMNLSRARALALQNDLEGVAKEIGRQGMTAAKFGNMNRIQQEAYAKAIGLSREQLGKMLVSQANLTNLTNEQVQNATGLSIEEYKAMGATETWHKTLEKLFQAWTPLLMPVLQIITWIGEAITKVAGGIGWVTSGFGLFSKAAAKSGEEVGGTLQRNQASVTSLAGSFLLFGTIGTKVLGRIGGAASRLGGRITGLFGKIGGGLGKLLGGIAKGVGKALGAVGKGLAALLQPLSNPYLLIGAVALVAVAGAVRLLAGAAEATSRALGNMAAVVKDLSWKQIGQLAVLGPTMFLVGRSLALAAPSLVFGSLGLAIFGRRLKKLRKAVSGVQGLAGSIIYLASAIGILKTNLNGLDTRNLKAIRKEAVKAINSIEAGKLEAVSAVRQAPAVQASVKETAVRAESERLEKMVNVIANRVSGVLDVRVTNWDIDKIGRQLAVETTQG